jgi:hypothetical protein
MAKMIMISLFKWLEDRKERVRMLKKRSRIKKKSRITRNRKVLKLSIKRTPA